MWVAPFPLPVLPERPASPRGGGGGGRATPPGGTGRVWTHPADSARPRPPPRGARVQLRVTGSGSTTWPRPPGSGPPMGGRVALQLGCPGPSGAGPSLDSKSAGIGRVEPGPEGGLAPWVSLTQGVTYLGCHLPSGGCHLTFWWVSLNLLVGVTYTSGGCHLPFWWVSSNLLVGVTQPSSGCHSTFWWV